PARFVPITGFSPIDSDEAPQPKGLAGPETGDGSYFSSSIVKVNGTLWGVQSMRNGLHWFQIDSKTGHALQEGRIAHAIDGNFVYQFYYPSIAVNELGDVVIGFNASGPNDTQYISSYAVIGKTDGGFTTFGAPMLLKAGVSTYQRITEGR